jgi:hypothetical protein
MVVVRRPAADVPKAPAPAAGVFPPGRILELPEDRGYTSDLSAGWMP